MSNATTKPTKPTKPKSEKPAKAERPTLLVFQQHAPAEILSPDGLINVPNPEDHGFDEKKHERLGRSDFASESLWLTYKIKNLRTKAAAMIAKADKLEAQAREVAKFGDPQKRAKVKKLQRMAAALAELRGVLAADGVDIDSLLSSS